MYTDWLLCLLYKRWCVNISFGGGRHRIATAKLLEMDEIPAVVLVQHPDYEGSK